VVKSFLDLGIKVNQANSLNTWFLMSWFILIKSAAQPHIYLLIQIVCFFAKWQLNILIISSVFVLLTVSS